MLNLSRYFLIILSICVYYDLYVCNSLYNWSPVGRDKNLPIKKIFCYLFTSYIRRVFSDLSLPNLKSMEQCIRQNNAIDIYEDYFETVDEATQCEKPEAKTVHVFRDPTTTQYKRPISAVSW